MKGKRARSRSSPRRKSKGARTTAKRRRSAPKPSRPGANPLFTPASLPSDVALTILSFCCPGSTAHLLSTCSALSRLSPDAWRQKIRVLPDETSRAFAGRDPREGVSAAAYWNGCYRKEHSMSKCGKYDFCLDTNDEVFDEYDESIIVAKIDEQTFVAGYGKRTVKVWDVASGLCLSTLTRRSNTVWFEFIVPNCGRTLTLWNGGNKVQLWDFQSGKCLRTIHNGHIEGVVLGVIRVSEDRFVSWTIYAVNQLNVRTGRVSTLVSGNNLPWGADNIRAVLKRDAQCLIIFCCFRAYFFDTSEREIVGSFVLRPIFRDPVSVTHLANRQVVAISTNGESASLGVWDIESGEYLSQFLFNLSGTVDTVVNMSDRMILIGSQNSSMKKLTVGRRCLGLFDLGDSTTGATSIARISNTEFVASAREGLGCLYRPNVSEGL